jgi:hypothetical protein
MGPRNGLKVVEYLVIPETEPRSSACRPPPHQYFKGRLPECLWSIHAVSYRNKEAQENIIEVIIEYMALEQFGAEEVKQKMKSLRSICGGGQNKIQDLHDHDPICTSRCLCVNSTCMGTNVRKVVGR